MKVYSTTDGCSSVDQMQYKSVFGSLVYLSIRTGPDIAYTVGSVTRFVPTKLSSMHWTDLDVKCIMQYVRGTLNLRLLCMHRLH